MWCTPLVPASTAPLSHVRVLACCVQQALHAKFLSGWAHPKTCLSAQQHACGKRTPGKDMRKHVECESAPSTCLQEMENFGRAAAMTQGSWA